MQLLIAAAAFDAHAAKAADNARAACSVAQQQGVDLIVLPGCSWKKRDVASLSRDAGELFVCACLGEESVIFREGEARLVQASLYGDRERGDDIALLDVQGVSVAILAGADARAPQSARLAALRGAQLLLCPVERDENDAGPWAQAQQNDVFAAVAPSGGEARVLSPLFARCPDGVLARGRHGTMAIAMVSLVEWARRKLSGDILAQLNRPFAAAMPPQELPVIPAAPMKVAAVQRTADPSGGRKRLVERMEAFCAQAKEQGCSLIAFPEYNWLDGLGSCPMMRAVNARANAAHPVESWVVDEESEDALAAFFPDAPTHEMPFLATAALRIMSGPMMGFIRRETVRLAKQYGLVVHGGTYHERKKRRMYNTAIIAFPDGSIVRQRKLHPVRQERDMGISPGSDLAVFDVKGAGVCAPICMDASYYEPFAAARHVGCDVAVLPICNGELYLESAAKRGAWARAVENCMYIVKPALTGMMLGQVYTGYAGIYGPNAEPLAQSAGPVGDELVVAELDFEALRVAQTLMPVPNAALEGKLRQALAQRER